MPKFKETEYLKYKPEDAEKLACEFGAALTHPRLRGLCVALGWWTYVKFCKPIIITDLWRNPIANKPSAHYCQPRCRAVDIRAKNHYWSKDAQEAIISWLDQNYGRTDGLKIAWFHGEGDNFHLHIQIQD